jgi:hypothetical protein
MGAGPQLFLMQGWGLASLGRDDAKTVSTLLKDQIYIAMRLYHLPRVEEALR